jgi:hypothetical protein
VNNLADVNPETHLFDVNPGTASPEVNPAENVLPDVNSEENAHGNGSLFRKSSRHTEPIQRLAYPQLGNPLVTVVQSLSKFK